jgi:SPP1 family predicted phage head-tail adaptor
LRAGSARQRIAIQRDTGSTNDYGEQEPANWVTQYSRWAEVKFEAGNKRFTADVETAKQAALFVIRYDAALFAAVLPADDWRIWWDGRAFDMIAIENRNQANREIKISAIERIEQGGD